MGNVGVLKYHIQENMKLSSHGFLVLFLFVRLSKGLPVEQVTNSPSVSKETYLLAQNSCFQPSSRPDPTLNQHKTDLGTNPTILLAGTSAQALRDEQSESQYRNQVVSLSSKRTPTNKVPSTLEAISVTGEHALRLYSRAYGRAHDYALVCAGNRWDTQYCQGAFLRYSCNSYGKLVQTEGGIRSETCDSICTCVDLSPKPVCLSGYLGTTTCF